MLESLHLLRFLAAEETGAKEDLDAAVARVKDLRAEQARLYTDGAYVDVAFSAISSEVNFGNLPRGSTM